MKYFRLVLRQLETENVPVTTQIGFAALLRGIFVPNIYIELMNSGLLLEYAIQPPFTVSIVLFVILFNWTDGIEMHDAIWGYSG